MTRSRTAPLLLAVAGPFVSAILISAYAQLHVKNPAFRGVLWSAPRWDVMSASDHDPFWRVLGGLLLASGLATALALWNRRGLAGTARGIGTAHLWFLLLPLHQWAFLTWCVGSESPDWAVSAVLLATPVVACFSLAGWLATLWQTACPPRESRGWLPFAGMVLSAIAYVGVYCSLSIAQYDALHVPHGDTAMYEEHLWNTSHGKGFRSQLDDGRLFLGEHFEVIHLLLLPIHALAPSLVTLNVVQSLALGSGALLVYLLARRLGLSPGSSATLGCAWLLYFPLQYLNLEASWKTFRPESLGVPILLGALVAWESRAPRTFLALLGLSFLVKEEYALVGMGLGVYAGCFPLGPTLRSRAFGLGVLVASAAFLVVVLAVLIPYFRGENAPHYTPYFQSLGSSPSEIVQNVVLHPFATWGRLTEPAKLRFPILMLLPVGFVAFASPARFLVSLPIFGYLMLGDLPILTQPWFHFHGPLVPLVFWSATGGIVNLTRFLARRRWSAIDSSFLARMVFGLCLASGIWFGESPLSWKFHDPLEAAPVERIDGVLVARPKGGYYATRYLVGPRARAFAEAAATIRPDERVAATDELRTRFTHFRAAHDYPTFRRHVTIDDLDVILLDITFGWWGRGPTNPDRELLACMLNPACQPSTRLTIRGRPFEVIFHDKYFLVVRQVRDNTNPAATP